MFRVGDKVKVVNLSESRAGDIEADLQMDLDEGVIKEKTYEKIYDIMTEIMEDNSPVLTVCEVDAYPVINGDIFENDNVDETNYFLRLGRLNLRCCFRESELQKHE